MHLKTVFLVVLANLLGVALLKGQTEPPTEVASEVAVALNGDYIIQPLDLLQVKIFQEADMDREVRVSHEYVISLPLIGRVDVRNRTVREAENLIRDLYNKDFLVNPQVNVTVLDYARRIVKVLGAVAAPGEIQFPQEEGLTLLDAIARAGGFTRLADRRRVRLTRRLQDDTQQTFTVNVDELIDGNASRVWTLQTNDLIYVTERLL